VLPVYLSVFFSYFYRPLLFVPFLRGVLQLNELSRRMETMLEQILPFSTEETDPNVVFKEELEMQAGESGNNATTGMKTADGTGGATTATAAGQGNNGMKIKHKNKFGNNQISAIPHQSSVFASDQRSFVPHADRLANFYRKYNRILLDNVAINKEKERLQIENSQLQDLIQQYLDGMKISDEILADDNPLFVVNGRYVFYLLRFLSFYLLSFVLELILIMSYQLEESNQSFKMLFKSEQQRFVNTSLALGKDIFGVTDVLLSSCGCFVFVCVLNNFRFFS
jgi:hypothetical protein